MGLGQIFKEQYPKFKAYAFSLVRDHSSAEDIVMEVFKKLIERQNDLSTVMNIEAYIMRSVKNQFLDSIKKEKFVKPIEAADQGEVVDVGSSSQVSADSNLESLLKTLDKLGRNCQTVLTLMGLGYTYQQIGDIEGIAMGTVKSRMARCRDGLLAIYQE
jgi:RNA polymerase sigma factor (sigma-70 family)